MKLYEIKYNVLYIVYNVQSVCIYIGYIRNGVWTGMSLYIKNSRLVDPKSGADRVCDILCEDGKIVRIVDVDDNAGEGSVEEIARNLEDTAAEVIDATGMIVAPGLVDVHSHFRDPGQTQKEDILTGAEAAAAGGYTSIIMMANTVPTVDNEETLSYVLEKGRNTKINIYACANVTAGMKGEHITDMKTLHRAGAVGFTDDGKPIVDEALLRSAMKTCAELNVPISLHEEDPAYVGVAGVNEGEVSRKMGVRGADRQAEITMVERDLKIAMETGAAVDIQHISAAESVELVRQAREEERRLLEKYDASTKKRTKIHAEATPHHFSLTEQTVERAGTLAKVNPPIRTEADRQAILKGLKDGTIDLIATDHAPHTAEEKSREFPKAPSGMIGLETALSLGVRELVNTGVLSMTEFLKKLTVNPAELYHLDAGYVAEGGPADLVIFDPKAKFTYGDYRSKSSNSPFTGQTGPAPVMYTVCGGEIVYRREKVHR